MPTDALVISRMVYCNRLYVGMPLKTVALETPIRWVSVTSRCTLLQGCLLISKSNSRLRCLSLRSLILLGSGYSKDSPLQFETVHPMRSFQKLLLHVLLLLLADICWVMCESDFFVLFSGAMPNWVGTQAIWLPHWPHSRDSGSNHSERRRLLWIILIPPLGERVPPGLIHLCWNNDNSELPY